MPLRHFTRLLAAAGTVFLATEAAPAFAQADLGVSMVLVGTSVDTDGFTLGGTETYRVTVTNDGPTHVTEFTLDATLDAALDDPTTVDDPDIEVTGCTPVDTTEPIDPFPCTVSGTLLSGGDVTVDISVTYPAPDPLPTTCPDGAVSVVSSISISGGAQDTTPVADPNAANDTSTSTEILRNWADLEITSIDGPGTTGENQVVAYTVVVANNGPCAAPAVRLSFFPAGSLTYVAGSVSASCTNGDAGFEPLNRCELDTLDPDESNTVTVSYGVGGFGNEMTHTAVATDVSIASRTVTTVPKADDPDTGNNSDGTVATVDLTSKNEGGCSTGGAGTLLGGLAALLALRLRRRG